MSSVSTLDAVLQQTATVNANVAQTPPKAPEPGEDDTEEPEAQEAPEPGEKQFETFLRKAERAFVKGNRGLLLSRVECGKWCHECYVLRAQQAHKNRGFTSQIIFNRLAIHADNKAECDAVELAKMYKAVELLCTEERLKAMSKLPIHPLTIGKLLEIAKLVERVEGLELYACFDPARLEDAKALFVWACGDGIDKPARADIAARVLELKDPEKFAAKQEEKRKAEEAKAKAAAQGAADDDGLIQRLQLLVYPDTEKGFRNVDRWPDTETKERVSAPFHCPISRRAARGFHDAHATRLDYGIPGIVDAGQFVKLGLSPIIRPEAPWNFEGSSSWQSFSTQFDGSVRCFTTLRFARSNPSNVLDPCRSSDVSAHPGVPQ